jgi:hypothetical protein
VKQFIMAIITILVCEMTLAEDMELNFTIPEDQETEALSLHGYFSGNYTGVYIPNYPPGFLLDFYGYEENDYFNTFNLNLALSGEYSNEDMGFFCQSFTDIRQDEIYFTFYEIYGRFNPSYNFSFQLGKIIYNWGKGYAFNAVGFVNPAKDPRLPDKIKEGIPVLDSQLLFSFPSEVLASLALDLVIIPGKIASDATFDIEDTDYALKISFLIAGMDIDLMGRYSSQGQHQLGADFAFNLLENLEFHAEGSYTRDVPKVVFENNTPQTNTEESWKLLCGIRYLSPWNTTVILEYLHNSAGYNASEYKNVINYIDNTMTSGTGQQISILRRDYMLLLNKVGQMQNYLYLKLTQPEPFDLLYFTPSLAFLLNFDGLSLGVSSPLSYKPVNNFEIIVEPCFYFGEESSELGNKPELFQIDFELLFYF